MRLVSLAICAGAATLASAASAQISDEPGEIIVTANKTDQRLIDVPASITVYDQRFIERARIRSLRQLDDYSPNVSINQIGQVGGTFISIRGIESNPFIINRAAVYIDGIPFRDPDAQVLADAAQVEILKGPQGTLYGANGNAGVIVIRTLDPGEELQGHVSGAVEAFGNGQSWPIRARIAGPIAEGVRGSISLSHEHGAAYVRNDASSIGERGSIENFQGVAKLRIEPAAGTRLDLLAFRTAITAPGVYEQEFAPVDSAIYDRNYRDLFNGGRSVARFGLLHDAPKRTQEREWGLGAALTQSLGGNTALALAASWRAEEESSFGTDIDLTALPAAAGGNRNRNRYLNLEARVSGGATGAARWVLGAMYYDESKRVVLSTLAGPGTLADFSPAPPQSAEARDIAAFGQLILPLVPRLEATLGLRYDNARRGRQQQAGVLDLGPLGQFGFAAADESATFDDLLPKIALSYALAPGAQIYASVAKGWLPGGFNLEASRFGAADDFGRYGKESLWSYEIGAKAELLERKLFLAGAVFLIDAPNWQEFNVLTGPSGEAISTNFITSNAAIRSKGAELELQARLVDGLELTFGAGYIDAEYRRYRFSPTQDFSGNRVKLVPEFDLTSTIHYRHKSGLFVRGEARVTGNTALNPENSLIQGTIAVLGAQAGYEGERLTVRAFASNLTNARYFAGQAYANFAFGNDGTFYAPLSAPRILGLEAEFRW
ncbi:TonB-dependent receptor [Polymorphobacter multimanifer]|uniref:Iron complex outermembrane receptor protein n=1 Tax=Polymorphobacter multimanifer TaxID=1070431 RepID=A0A841LA85_9SPHN|nr:TonB-dependent receptor [Polymorphobacter multimanifer]MBB6229444.1 iron complex outermembrane receptor protein [Polymorphobacter multimanifer]GGI91629.1 TonB-dependent receptor [Polymorphobacter multimanifer]